jgi:hypothetical protein
MENTELEKTEEVITDISEETLLSLDENLELDQENTEIAEGKCKKEEEEEEEEDDDEDEDDDEEEMSEAKKVQEAEVSSDEEFMEYSKSILKAAFGDKYDEDKAMKTAEGILKKSDGDYGAAIGMLTSGLGEEMDDMEKDMKEDTQSEITVDSRDISRLVESEEGLTEEFKEKATTIFEAAVKSKVKEAEEALKESYAVTLIEEVEAIKEGMVDKIDNYLTYAVECWVEDNKVAIESSLRTEIAENFIKSLKGVFAENYIEVPEGKVDLYAKLEKEKAAAETKLAESLELVSGLVESVESLSREKIITECTSDLADTQAEKLKSLIEDVQYSSEEKFRSKVETIKEFYINGPLFDSESKTVNEEVEDSTHSFITTETIVEDEGEASVSPAMKNYLTAISRLNKATTANI